MNKSSSTSLKDFKVIKKLGEGSFSQVYKVQRISDKKEYAMKKVKMNMLKPKERENALNEVRLLASINSDYIVGYKDAFFQENCLHVIMEFCEQGDIAGQVKDAVKKAKHIPENTIWKALIQITRGLKHLHDMNILHRDLKGANIFVDGNGTYKLGDMNVSKAAKKALVFTQVGTPYYCPPEIWSDKPYNNKCDIWSLGCVIYEMAALKPPFRAMDMEGLYRKIKRGQFDRIPGKYSQALSTVLSKCLKVNPTARYDVNQLLNDPYVVEKINAFDEDSTSASSNGMQSNKNLLCTIKCPRNLFSLNGVLPKPQYQKKMSSESTHDLAVPQSLNQIEEIDSPGKKDQHDQRRHRIVSAGIRRNAEQQNSKQKLEKINQKANIYDGGNQNIFKPPVINKHDANSNNILPAINNNKATPRRSLQNNNNVKPPMSQNPSYQNIKPRYMLPSSKSPYNAKDNNYKSENIIDTSENNSRVVRNKNRQHSYCSKNNKYEYLYLRNEAQDRQRSNSRPGSSRQQQKPPQSYNSNTPQVNRKSYQPSYDLYGGNKVSQSYEQQQKLQLVDKIKQKERLLLGLDNNKGYQNQRQQSPNSMNRYQSAKNSLHKKDNSPNYHQDKGYNPYDYVYKKKQHIF